jgi:hypothetical protein
MNNQYIKTLKLFDRSRHFHPCIDVEIMLGARLIKKNLKNIDYY